MKNAAPITGHGEFEIIKKYGKSGVTDLLHIRWEADADWDDDEKHVGHDTYTRILTPEQEFERTFK